MVFVFGFGFLFFLTLLVKHDLNTVETVQQHPHQKKQTSNSKEQSKTKAKVFTQISNKEQWKFPGFGSSECEQKWKANRSPSWWLSFHSALCWVTQEDPWTRESSAAPSLEYWLCGKFKDPSWEADVSSCQSWI